MAKLTRPVDESAYSSTCRKILNHSPFIMQVYEDGTDTYVCKAVPGTALTDALWQIVQYDTNGNARKCDGDEKFNNVATNAGVVAALSYS